jgi:Zn-dependent peptidase ImmA (M78 family)
MGLRRGFKAEANWWARELRGELGLQPIDPLCPWRLCEYLDIPLIPLNRFAVTNPAQVAYLYSVVGQKEFSAVTLVHRRRRIVIYNDAHDRKRQASDLAHEIAHALLHHPTHALLSAQGNRHYEREIEEEANWLGPALLISDEAALRIAARMTIAEASEYYGATKEVVLMRVNVSGARKRVA